MLNTGSMGRALYARAIRREAQGGGQQVRMGPRRVGASVAEREIVFSWATIVPTE